MTSASLTDTLKLEPIEMNLFRGTTPDPDLRQRIYGGQVIAQSLLAAYATVEARTCHSLHCYFIRPGDPNAPIVFDVDRSRDGGSFTTRRVVAIQHGRQIFNLAASFQAQEDGFEHQAEMPDAPSWETLADDFDIPNGKPQDEPDRPRSWLDRPQPIEMRSVGGRLGQGEGPREPVQQVWFRARDPIGADPRQHQVILAYASDMNLLGTAARAHSVDWRKPDFQVASLDHAMWFHRPTDFNQWHLYHMESPSASGGRGFNLGSIFRADGTLVASCAQEGLMRIRQPKG